MLQTMLLLTLSISQTNVESENPCAGTIIDVERPGQVPQVAPWPEGHDNFYTLKNGDTAMDTSTARVVFCRLQALNILPEYFAIVLDANVKLVAGQANLLLAKQAADANKALQDQRKQLFSKLQVAGYVVSISAGALLVGYIAGRL